jgi:hypothetical protein
MRRTRIGVSILVLVLGLFGFKEGEAQAPGYAEITTPLPGEAVKGLLTIKGSASHPLFVSYDLAFTFQDDALTTWFPIVENREVQVVDGRLGLWDTNGVSDGEYQLRLRVRLENGTTLEHVLEGIRIRNQSIIETATPGPVVGVLPTTTALPPTPTSRPTPVSPVEAPGGSNVTRAFQYGLILGALLTLSLGAYLFIRRSVRIRWGILRMRRMLWRDERRKRPGG